MFTLKTQIEFRFYVYRWIAFGFQLGKRKVEIILIKIAFAGLAPRRFPDTEESCQRAYRGNGRYYYFFNGHKIVCRYSTAKLEGRYFDRLVIIIF